MRQVIITPDESGNGYTATCPSLPGCFSEGDTLDETLANITEAIELWIEDALANGDSIPPDLPQGILVTSVATA